jgi:hypothetical protein
MTNTERNSVRLCILDLLVAQGRIRLDDSAQEIRRMFEGMDDAQLIAFHEQVANLK